MAELMSTPYDTGRALFGGNVETWLNAYDAARLASYKLYEDIYFNNPNTFKVVMRGTNENPIYIPTGKIIVNTMNRYVCRDFQVVPDSSYGSAADRLLMSQIYDTLFKREGFYSAFDTNKLFGIMRGDACWMISADSEKPEGSRISIETIDPGSVFWVYESEGSSKIRGVDVVEQVAFGDKVYIKRQRWLKSSHPDHPAATTPPTFDGEISYQVDSFEIDGWEDPTTAKAFPGGDSEAAEVLPGITQLPIYNWKNFDQPENPWGSSEMRGLETLIAGVNQGASDQDLALAIAGLGIFVTDAGAPVDEDDNEVPWGLGPAEVVEVAVGRKFERINGITTVDPSLSHIRYLQEQAYRTTGASDVAQGVVDTTVAESGIALKLRLGPILDEGAVKERLIMTVVNQMMFDLRQWFDVYEGVDFGEYDALNPGASTVMVGQVGPRLPEDDNVWTKFLMEGYNSLPAIFSGEYVRSELRRMGRDIPDETEMLKQIAKEAAFFSAATDPEGTRLAEEGEDDGEDEDV